MNKALDGQELTREQHIFLWKTEGGNYSWARWAAMHDIPVHTAGFRESLAVEQSPLPTYKQKRRRKK